MNYNSLMNKPTINYRELIGDNTVTEVGGITEEQFNTLLNTDLTPYYTKAQIDDLFSRSYVYREKSGSIVTFDCPSTPQNIPEVTAEIVAVQAGTGDPSPQNVRPFSGFSVVNVYDGPTTDPQDATVYTTALKDGQGNPMTCYGGQLVNENGVQRLTNIDEAVDMGDLSWGYQSSNNRFSSSSLQSVIKTTDSSSANYILCEIYKPSTDRSNNSIYVSNTGVLLVYDDGFTDANDFKTAVTGYKLKYTLATPQQISQDSLSIATQEGVNNIWCDSGDITVKALDKIIQE